MSDSDYLNVGNLDLRLEDLAKPPNPYTGAGKAVAAILAHPNLRSREIAELTGQSDAAIRHAAHRYHLKIGWLKADMTIAPDNLRWLAREAAESNLSIGKLLNAIITDARADG